MVFATVATALYQLGIVGGEDRSTTVLNPYTTVYEMMSELHVSSFVCPDTSLDQALPILRAYTGGIHSHAFVPYSNDGLGFTRVVGCLVRLLTQRTQSFDAMCEISLGRKVYSSLL